MVVDLNIIGECNAQYECFSIRYSPKDNVLVEMSFSNNAKVVIERMLMYSETEMHLGN